MMTSWSCFPIWLKRVFQVVALFDNLASIVNAKRFYEVGVPLIDSLGQLGVFEVLVVLGRYND